MVRVNGTAISTSGFADPMTTRGDIIVRDASNDTERLAVGGASEVLSSDGTDVVWASLTSLGALENVSEDTTPQLGGALDGQNNTIDNVKAVVDARTSTSETTTNADSGQVITLTNGSAITFTVHAAAPAGFVCTIIQGGAGQVTVAAGGTGNVRNFNGHTKLAGQYAMGTVFVRSNAGTAPEVYFQGQTA